MKNNNKWTVRDVITTVLLTVALILIQLVINMVCMVNDFVSMVLSVGITMLLCAPVYFLMVSRVHKRLSRIHISLTAVSLNCPAGKSKKWPSLRSTPQSRRFWCLTSHLPTWTLRR